MEKEAPFPVIERKFPSQVEKDTRKGRHGNGEENHATKRGIPHNIAERPISNSVQVSERKRRKIGKLSTRQAKQDSFSTRQRAHTLFFLHCAFEDANACTLVENRIVLHATCVLDASRASCLSSARALAHQLQSPLQQVAENGAHPG
eukprot:scaffold283_cov316-Pavlova_lutheri.AAC.21